MKYFYNTLQELKYYQQLELRTQKDIQLSQTKLLRWTKPNSACLALTENSQDLSLAQNFMILSWSQKAKIQSILFRIIYFSSKV